MERPKPQVLEWDEVAEAAGDLFNVWMSGSEAGWARESWRLLGQVGLTRYENEVGRCRVSLQLLTLASLYRDFCFLAWDEYAPLDLQWGADVLQVSPLRVGQLVGTGDPAIDQRDDEEVLELALLRLVSEARGQILDVLIKEYGGVTGLFIALWRASEPGYDPSPQMRLFRDKEDGLSEWGIVNDDIGWGKLRAYEWLAEGADSHD